MSLSLPDGFDERVLKNDARVHVGQLPDWLLPDDEAFERLWCMHPAEQPRIFFGDEVRTSPRWDQAYGHDYAYSGKVSRAVPVSDVLEPYLSWVREAVDPRLNGLLVNWYDAAYEHRIAPHKDSPTNRVAGCPIVTISLGADRVFLLHTKRKPEGVPLTHGTVVVLPDETNAKCSHSVPHRPEDVGRRISVTIRGFVGPGVGVASAD